MQQQHHRKCLEQILYRVKNRRENSGPKWTFETPDLQFEVVHCTKCGDYIYCGLFCGYYYKWPTAKKILNGINQNYFFVEKSFKKIQCQCVERTKENVMETTKKTSRNAEFCYNCYQYDCSYCVYETDHEDDLSQMSNGDYSMNSEDYDNMYDQSIS
jgi:hypothetical protein